MKNALAIPLHEVRKHGAIIWATVLLITAIVQVYRESTDINACRYCTGSDHKFSFVSHRYHVGQDKREQASFLWQRELLFCLRTILAFLKLGCWVKTICSEAGAKCSHMLVQKLLKHTQVSSLSMYNSKTKPQRPMLHAATLGEITDSRSMGAGSQQMAHYGQ